MKNQTNCELRQGIKNIKNRVSKGTGIVSEEGGRYLNSILQSCMLKFDHVNGGPSSYMSSVVVSDNLFEDFPEEKIIQF